MQKQNWETRQPPQLYTSEQKKRRDESIWTLIQGVLAPTQFIAFAISTVLVIWYLWTGDGYGLATISVLVKTTLLLTIMVTGAIWEKVVFGQYLLAPAFFAYIVNAGQFLLKFKAAKTQSNLGDSYA